MITKLELNSLIASAPMINIALSSLVFDVKKYSRSTGIDKGAVNDYSKKLLSMPPIIINQDNIIVDGVHRYHAALKLEQSEIQCKQIELPESDIELVGLLIDLCSGVRHPEQDTKRMCVKLYSEEPKENRKLFTELDVPESTFYEWTADIRKERKKQLYRAIASELLNPFSTQKMIADDFNVSQQTVSNLKNAISLRLADIAKISNLPKNEQKNDVLPKILDTGKISNLPKNEQKNDVLPKDEEIQENYLDFLDGLLEFEPVIYNIWKTPKRDSSNDRFGHFPLVFMKNLLYYHTEPFDFVYDPFGGGGTTADACRELYRQYYLTDLTPEPSLPYIKQWDIANGLPDDLPKPDLVFLDPPYWKQAEGKYSELGEDLSNMELDVFYNTFNTFITQLVKRHVAKIAIVIQPTQYANQNHKFEDHIFKFHEMLYKKYSISMRYILPYSTEQCTPQMVIEAKDKKICLGMQRDLVVWEVNV